MLSKEESLKKAKELSYGWHVGDNEFVPLKDVNKLIREIYSIKPYKFEDLKDGMFVYEINLDNIYLIYYTTENIKTGARYIYACGCGDSRLTQLKFEENSFFPVQMANVGCE